jgi:hypothetical protein
MNIKYKTAMYFVCLNSLIACGNPTDINSSQTNIQIEPASQLTNTDDVPYNIWISDTSVSPIELGEKLKNDITFADKICANDTHAPQNYSTYFALISTHEYDRQELVKMHNIDLNASATLGSSNKLLPFALGSVFFDEESVNIKKLSPEHIKITKEKPRVSFTANSKFSGYCENEKDYSLTTSVISENPTPQKFTIYCSNETAHLSCMAIR